MISRKRKLQALVTLSKVAISLLTIIQSIINHSLLLVRGPLNTEPVLQPIEAVKPEPIVLQTMEFTVATIVAEPIRATPKTKPQAKPSAKKPSQPKTPKKPAQPKGFGSTTPLKTEQYLTKAA